MHLECASNSTRAGGRWWVSSMRIVQNDAGPIPPLAEWHDNKTYCWITTLPRHAIAWEFLRRYPRYRDAYARQGNAAGFERSEWPMVRLEDPMLDAYHAVPAWTMTVCDEILPVVSGESPLDALRSAFDLDRLSCQMQMIEDEDATHIVFAYCGRQLQLEMHTRPNAGEGIFTPAVPPASLSGKRTLALRRLADLAEHGTLRDPLYPAEARALRMARILQALDGAMAGARHRDIAVSLFGERRVMSDWGLPDNHLRDHVRRAIAHGRMLMSGGFVRLLG